MGTPAARRFSGGRLCIAVLRLDGWLDSSRGKGGSRGVGSHRSCTLCRLDGAGEGRLKGAAYLTEQGAQVIV